MLSKPVKRLSKRQIKEDKLVTTALATWAWLQDNYPKLIGGAVGLVCLILVGNYVMGAKDRRAAEAADVFAQAQIAAMEERAGDVLLHGEEAYRKYSGDGSAAQALLLVANTYFSMRRVAEAREAFQKCLKDYAHDPVMAYAGWNGLAAGLEQEGNMRAAAEKYEEFAKNFERSPFAAASLKEAARCYGMAGDARKERELLNLLTDRYKDTPLAPESQARLKTM